MNEYWIKERLMEVVFCFFSIGWETAKGHVRSHFPYLDICKESLGLSTHQSRRANVRHITIWRRLYRMIPLLFLHFYLPNFENPKWKLMFKNILWETTAIKLFHSFYTILSFLLKIEVVSRRIARGIVKS